MIGGLSQVVAVREVLLRRLGRRVELVREIEADL
jgi:hypothetical protein